MIDCLEQIKDLLVFENAMDLDQKVLTALMMIEKDYLAKNRFNVIIARPKKLFVRVESSVIKNELMMMRSQIIEKMNERAGGEVILEIVLL